MTSLMPNTASDGESKIMSNKIPHAEKALHQWKSHLDPAWVEIINKILTLFSTEVLQNTKLFTTKWWVSFPYTTLDLVAFARKVMSGQNTSIDEHPQEWAIVPKKIQYIFGSFLEPSAGNSMSFIEETIHQAMKKLPAIIDALNTWKKVENTIIYNLGSPTNTKWTMTEKFFQATKNDPYGTFGDMYAEFIRAQEDWLGAKNIELYGISMGSNFAIRAGEILKKSGQVWQPRTGNPNPEGTQDKPQLTVRAESPVSFGKSRLKTLQIPMWFLIDQTVANIVNILSGKNSPAEQKAKQYMDNEFNKKMNTNMDEGQSSLKKWVIWQCIKWLWEELPIDPKMTVIQVFGKQDTSLMHPDNLNKSQPWRHTYWANMWHTRPFFDSPSDILRMEKLIELIKRNSWHQG